MPISCTACCAGNYRRVDQIKREKSSFFHIRRESVVRKAQPLVLRKNIFPNKCLFILHRIAYAFRSFMIPDRK